MVSSALKITESMIPRQYHILHQPSIPITSTANTVQVVTLTLLHPVLLDGPCQREVRRSMPIQELATKLLTITLVGLCRLKSDGLADDLLLAQSHAYSHIPDMASLHDEDTDPELFHQAAQRLHYSQQQQQLHRPQQDYPSQPPRPSHPGGYSNEKLVYESQPPPPSHVNAPAGGYDANQYRPQQEYGSQPPHNVPASGSSHNEEYRPPRPSYVNAPAGGYQHHTAPTGGHNAPTGGFSGGGGRFNAPAGGGDDDQYSSHLAAHEQAYG